jgi:hypothetical protein
MNKGNVILSGQVNVLAVSGILGASHRSLGERTEARQIVHE